MTLRLRQICLVAEKLDPVVDGLAAVLGLQVCYRDPNVARYGLVNALLPVDTSFLEVVAPLQPETAAGRYLQRRGGDGGYMVILDCDDLQRRGPLLDGRGIRVANRIRHETYTGLQLHPRDTGGCMLELNWTDGGQELRGPYHPAGPAWQGAVRRDTALALTAAVLQSPEPEKLARHWGTILERPVQGAGDSFELALDLGRLRFVPATDGRGEGLAALHLTVVDPARVRATAQARGLPVTGGPDAGGPDTVVLLGGMRLHLSAAR